MRAATPHVAILLCTYNGAQYLRAQLDSYLAQTHANWSLWVGDDGSKDATWAILEEFKAAHPERRITLRHGPADGFVKNFLTLACDPEIQADYYAFSDQDDVWFPDKLARAVAALEALPKQTPLLYGARSEFINEQGAPLGLSYPYAKKPSFKNALVQCIAGGNTMLFNNATRALLQKIGAHCEVASHDWFTYQAVMGVGGEMVYDLTPVLGYRQYRGAMSGSNRGLKPSIIRICKLFGGTFRFWNDRNMNGLTILAPDFTPKNQRRLALFARARKSGFLERHWLLVLSGVRRQTLIGNLGVLAASITGRL